jgi:hypothetical protein
MISRLHLDRSSQSEADNMKVCVAPDAPQQPSRQACAVKDLGHTHAAPPSSQRECVTASPTDVIPLQRIMHDMREEVQVRHRPPPFSRSALAAAVCGM